MEWLLIAGAFAALVLLRRRAPAEAGDRVGSDAVAGSRSSEGRSPDPDVAREAGHVTVAVPGARVSTPKGWLGALFAHGGACLAWELAYLNKQKHHLLPSVGARWSDDTNKVELDYNYIPSSGTPTLMSQRFVEWQCPAFDSQSPDFSRFNKGVTADEWAHAIDKTVWGDGKENYWIEAYLAHDVRGFQDEGHVIPHMIPGDRPARAVYDWIAWTVGRRYQADHRLLLSGTALLLPYLKNEVRPSSYWNSSAELRKKWGVRLMRWYWTAQFAVWSCEMLRIHATATHKAASNDWAAYCAAWGIGVHVADHSGKKDYASRPELGDKTIGDGLKSKLTRAQWEELRDLVMRHAPVPGTPGSNGEQIARPGHARHIFDVPESLGSAVPPIFIARGQYNMLAASKWLGGNDTKNFWTDRFLPVWNKVFGFFAGAAQSAAFNAFVSTANGAYTAGCNTLRAAAALANGDLRDATDVVAGIGELAGKVGAMTGTDVALPDDLWEQLQAAEKPLHGFGHGIGELLQERAEEVRGVLSAARANGYSYIDDLLGGVLKD